MIRSITFLTVFFLVLTLQRVNAQAFTENFDNVSSLAGNGWVISNVSNPVGSWDWFQGNSGDFSSYNGANDSYISANYNSTTNNGTINNWLITPNRVFRNGDVITFYTRTVNPNARPELLQVLLSSNGSSVNVGSSLTDPGDFTTELLSINPTLDLNGYPSDWTKYTATVKWLSAPTSGRIAFRYIASNSGASGNSGYCIGIDQVEYTPYVCPTITMSPTAGALAGGRAGTYGITSLYQTGALEVPSFAITAGALPPGLMLNSSGVIFGTPTATGTFNFTATVGDNSGCFASTPYSITVICPNNPLTFNSFSICGNDGQLELTTATPAGGTYSGTGVSGSHFDPAVGTQDVTYDYTDVYGCSYNLTSPIIVNTPPTVTLSDFNAACLGAEDITLAGGSPAGGTYSGANVSGGLFTPSALGNTTITYTYTDANNCTDNATASITVNALPLVTATALADVCISSEDVTLTGGSPAGGTYSGTNVSGGLFTPSASGTTTVTYTYMDANGCSDNATTSITVNSLPQVTATSLEGVCMESADVTLTGGAPAGGVYSGTNVSGGLFTPSTSGVTTITYTYTDANGCSDEATTSITVSVCNGVSESLAVPGLKYFPNPTTGILSVEFDPGYQSEIQIQISDVQGRKMITNNQNSYFRTLDLSTFQSGVYTMELRAGEKTAHYKIVVK